MPFRFHINSLTPVEDATPVVVTKFGATADTFLGNVSNDGSLIIPTEATELVFTGVKHIASQALIYKFYNTNVTSASFPDLEKIHTPSAAESAFVNSSLATLSVPKLTEISGAYCLARAFQATSLLSVEFTLVDTLTGRGCLEEAFKNARRIESISFPALTSSSFGSETGQFHNMLSGVTGCTVHFPAAVKSTIENWSDVVAGFGGTDTTILYDLGDDVISIDNPGEPEYGD